MFKRILKNLTALGGGHALHTLGHLSLPPIFLSVYGVQAYGEWLVLSAAVGYLSTLDFGLQTYVVNELTMLYHRGERERFRRVQSVAFRLLLGLLALGGVFAVSAFILPLGRWLKLESQPITAVWTGFLLALQLLAGVALGQIAGTYRVCNLAHHGAMWCNAQKLLLLVVTLSLALLRQPFWLIALGQLLTILLAIAAVLSDLRQHHTEVFPRLDFWDRNVAFGILKPSGLFGLLLLNNFIVYQMPVLILNHFLGAAAVVVFTVGRTLFSFARQGIALLYSAIMPEISRLKGLGDHERLTRLYRCSESTVLAAALVFNAGVYLVAPPMVSIWLGRPELFDPAVFNLLLVVSVLITAKDYKLHFQYAANQHSAAAVFTFVTYALMVAAAVPAVGAWGVHGFLVSWIAVEIIQNIFVLRFTDLVFAGRSIVRWEPALRALGVLALMAWFFWWSSAPLARACLAEQVIWSLLAMLALSAASYFLFDVRGLVDELRFQQARF